MSDVCRLLILKESTVDKISIQLYLTGRSRLILDLQPYGRLKEAVARL